MKQVEQDFCMRQFKPAIAVMAVLVVIIVGWTLWRVCPGSLVADGRPQMQGAGPGMGMGMNAIIPAALKKPTAPPVDVNDKMLHADWGNCNKCHVTTGAGKPVSKVMAGAPVTISQPSPHKYWGNCMLCHKVLDGFQPNGVWVEAPKGRGPAQAQAAALQWFTAQSLGVSVQPVTQAMMQKFGLPEDNALLVLDVAPGSVADKAGLAAGDEILRVGRASTKSFEEFESALNAAGPGADLKFGIIRDKKPRNIMVTLPKMATAQAAAALAPLAPAPYLQAQPQVVATTGGLLAIAAAGAGLNAAVAPQFDTAPFFVLVDPARRAFRVESNPNAAAPGFGVQTGQLMANLGVSGVVAGGFSPAALSTLGSLRIAGYPGMSGAVQDALTAYQAGGLTAASPGLAPQGAGAGLYPQTLY